MLEYYIMGIILIPGILLALFAQSRVNNSFNKWSMITSASGLTGAQVARKILNANGLGDINIVKTEGKLNDYYDSKNCVIALSRDVADSDSIASLGVSMHEVGHAIQFKENYLPVKFRNAIIPVCNLLSSLMWPLVILGILFNFVWISNSIWGSLFLWAGVIFFGLSVLLNLITLPVEFDASKRAVRVLQTEGILNSDEIIGAKEVLNSAALTYVAALVISMLNLLRFVLVFFRRRD